MSRKNYWLFFICIVIFSTIFSGCSKIDDAKVRLGIKNKDFDYIRDGKISKVVIQNKRDKGFTFIVTDKEAIKDLYDILSSSKQVDNKITLEPDYILEFHEGVKQVHKFSYVAGLDKKDAGNLYSEDKVYIVSKRLDDDIIRNFWNIRTPKEFHNVYYESMLKAIKDYRKSVGNEKTIGVDSSDEEVAKFILSMDLKEFSGNLDSKTEIIQNDDRNKYDITMDIETQGYKSDIYKCIITFYDKSTKKENKYYFINNYELGSWRFSFTKDKEPENF